MADIVHRVDRSRIIEAISRQLRFRSIMIMVVDIMDFEATSVPELYEAARKKKCHLVIVANKIDALPKGASRDRL